MSVTLGQGGVNRGQFQPVPFPQQGLSLGGPLDSDARLALNRLMPKEMEGDGKWSGLNGGGDREPVSRSQRRDSLAARQHGDVGTHKQETKGIANEKRCSARNKDMETTVKGFLHSVHCTFTWNRHKWLNR